MPQDKTPLKQNPTAIQAETMQNIKVRTKNKVS